jgi:dienelactone hydrolase
MLAILGFIAVLLGAGLLFLPPVQTAARTLALLPELIDLPVRPLSALTPEPHRISASYGSPRDRLDIYVPAEQRPDAGWPAVVLALGVHPQPIDHPDVVRVASSISRLGVVVGVPDSSALRETRLTPAEPGHLADAVMAIAGRPEVDRARVGIAGFSAGASMALIAAADPRISDDLLFVSAFGGYARAETLIVDVATRSALVDGQERSWPADAGVRRDVLELFLSALRPPANVENLRTLLQPVVDAEQPPIGSDAAVASRLRGDSLVAYLVFTCGDRAAAGAALARASPGLMRQLADLSPLAFADRIRAPVYLLHGANDRAIPVSHAVTLSNELRPDVVVRFTRFGRFEHGQPGADGLGLEDAPDVWELTLYLHDIVAAVTE